MDLSYTLVADLSPLKGLTALKELNLSGTKVRELGPLVGLTGLRRLVLPESAADLSALRGLTRLEELMIHSSQVRDLAPLKGLRGLKSLTIMYTEISDISPLQGLTGLERLILLKTEVRDLSALKRLTQLKELLLRDTPIKDLSGIEGLKSLTRLDLTRTRVADLSPLRSLTALTWLNLSETRVRSVGALRSLTKIRELDLSSTEVAEVTPLGGMTGLQQLVLSRTRVRDLRPLSGLASLHALFIAFTGVHDLSSLAGIKGLRRLSTHGTKVSRAQLQALQQALPSLELLHSFTDKRRIRFSNLGPVKIRIQAHKIWVYGVSGEVLLPQDKYPSSGDSSYPEVHLTRPFETYGHGRDLPLVTKGDWRVQADPLLELKANAPVDRVWYQRKSDTCGMRISAEGFWGITLLDVPCDRVRVARIRPPTPCRFPGRSKKWKRYRMQSPFAGESINLYPRSKHLPPLALNVMKAWVQGQPRGWQINGRQTRQGLEVKISTAYLTMQGLVGAEQEQLFQRAGPAGGLGCYQGSRGRKGHVTPLVAYLLEPGARIYYDARLETPVATVTRRLFFEGTKVDLSKSALTSKAPGRRESLRIDTWVGDAGLCRQFIKDRCVVNLFVSPTDAAHSPTDAAHSPTDAAKKSTRAATP